MHSRFTSLFASAVIAVAFVTTGRAQVISTLSSPAITSGSVYQSGGWGGQIFQTPGSAAATLDQFVIKVSGGSGAAFQAYVFEWTGSTAGTNELSYVTTPLLWSGTSTVGSSSLLTFDTGHLALNAATSYAFYFARSSGFDGITVPLADSVSYSSGGAVYWTRPGEGVQPYSVRNNAAYFDLQFEATFSAVSISPVPEPSTYATIGLALCGVLALVRRRRAGPPAPAVSA